MRFDTRLRPVTATTRVSAALLAVLCATAKASVNCDDVLAVTDEFFGDCTNKWKNAKPLTRQTQTDLGYAWVQRKFDKDFDSEDEAQDTLDAKLLPVVIGTNPNSTTGTGLAYYLTDGHHTLSALDWSGFDDVKVTFTVLADLRTLSFDQLWETLLCDYSANDWTRSPKNTSALPTQITSLSTTMPSAFAFNSDESSFGDDPWRALASFVRNTENDTCSDQDTCMRCYYRECNAATGAGIPFFEFRWSYFFNSAYLSPSYWTSSAAWAAFADAFDSLGNTEMGNIDYHDWQDVADTLTALCRGDVAGQYTLPEDYFRGGALPGYTAGYQPLPADPVCAASSFNASCTL